ncbi:MAG: hypothetical protein PHQ66_00940 [Candidatus Nanoarchaeia archaeon]|nr:hypothetical protein [Candidatus Nanoarchaeia archaeon]MDD5358052.1 hypothetical protein [Candidatus Nanoarchaeia archaeon]MDD5588971.1 hypothetical protein [Candidatus Nanoarchaeia archaeon]
MKDSYYRTIKKELKSRASSLGLPEERIEESAAIDKVINHNKEWIPPKEKDYIINRIVDRAVFLDGIYRKAFQLKINPKYINEIIKPKFDYSIGFGEPTIPDLGKMDKKEADKIIKKAREMQKGEEKGLTSRLYLIIGAGISLAGLFFLSSNVTGNAIGNIAIPTSKIIGAILFIGGLIATFFFLKKR